MLTITSSRTATKTQCSHREPTHQGLNRCNRNRRRNSLLHTEDSKIDPEYSGQNIVKTCLESGPSPWILDIRNSAFISRLRLRWNRRSLFKQDARLHLSIQPASRRLTAASNREHVPLSCGCTQIISRVASWRPPSPIRLAVLSPLTTRTWDPARQRNHPISAMGNASGFRRTQIAANLHPAQSPPGRLEPPAV